MQLNSAKNLISSLERQIDFSLPLNTQIEMLYEPSLLKKTVVESRSLHGRLSKWLNQSKNHKKQVAKVRKVFAEALKLLQNPKVTEPGSSLNFRIKLSQELHQELKDLEREYEAPVVEAEELQKLAKDLKEAEKAENAALRSQSLVRRNPSDKSDSLSLEKYLDTLEIQDSAKAIEFWQECVDKHPSTKSLVAERIPLIQAAHLFECKLQSTLFPTETTLEDSLFDQKMHLFASDMSLTAHHLASGEKYLFTGSYGKKNRSWKDLIAFFKQLPEVAKTSMPKSFMQLLSKETLISPENFVKELIHQNLEEVRKHLPASPSFNLSTLDPLFSNTERHLPDFLAQILPLCLKDPLNQRLQNGLLLNMTDALKMAPTDEIKELFQLLFSHHSLYQGTGTLLDQMPLGSLSSILSLIPSSSMLELIEWGVKNVHLLDKKESRDLFFQELELKIFHLLKSQDSAILAAVNKQIDQFLSQIQNLFPPQLLDLSGLSAYLNGEFWIELERQNDGQFTAIIYSSGHACHQHPLDIANGKIQWPLRIVNISPEKLNNDFFHRLLFHHLEPSRNSFVRSRSEDLFEGVIEYLGGRFEPFTEAFSSKNNLCQSKEELVGALLFGSSIPIEKHIFEIRFDHLLKFVRSYLSEPEENIVIPDEKTLKVFVEGLALTKKKLENVKVFYSSEEIVKIEATLGEIQKAIDNFHRSQPIKPPSFGENPLNLPQPVIQAIRQQLHQKGITLDQIQDAKSTLVWALGDEMGEFVDVFVESLDSQPFIPAPPSPPQADKGWLKLILTSTYYRMAFETLKVALSLARLYQNGFSPFLVVSLVHNGLRNVLPKPIDEWYNQTLGFLKRQMAEIFLQIVLHSLFSPEQVKKLQQSSASWKESLQNILRGLRGENLLSFDVSPEEITLPQTSSFTTKQDPLVVIIQETEQTVFPQLFEPKAKLKSHTALSQLNLWQKEAESKKQSIPSLLYLIDKLELLEIPTHEGWWDQVPQDEISTYIEALSQLGYQLQKYSRDGGSLFRAHADIFGRLVCAQYNLLSLLDRLARRSPDAHLEGFPVNPYPMLLWLKSKKSIMTNPQLLAQAHRLCQYFAPDLDPLNLPSKKELLKRASNTLFFYPNSTELSNEAKTPTLPEFKYLAKRLKDPEFRKKCQLLQIVKTQKANASDAHSSCKFDELRSEFQLAILFKESLAVKTTSPLFPTSYSLLRLQNLFCNQLINEGTSPHQGSIELKPEKHFINEGSPFFDYLSNFFSIKNSSFCSYENEKLFCNPSLASFEFLWGTYHSGKRKSQSSLTAAVSLEEYTELMGPLEKELFALTRAEKEDQLVRVLAFFKTHKNRLRMGSPNVLNFFDYALFKSGDLAKQLQTSPHFAKVIGDFFTEMCQDSIEKGDTFLLQWLVLEGLKLKKYCHVYAPEFQDSFPNFYDVLTKHPQPNPSEYEFTINLERLKALAFVDSETKKADFSIEKILKLTAVKFQETENELKMDVRCDHISSLLNQRIYLAFQEAYQIALPSIIEALSDKEIRSSIANNILKNDKTSDGNDHFVFWEQSSPLMIKKKEVELNFADGKISGLPVFHREGILKKIRHSLKRFHPQFSELQVVNENTFESSNKSLRVHYQKMPSALSSVKQEQISLECFLNKNGKTYRYHQLQNSSNFDSLDGFNPIENSGSCWIEETENQAKEILFYANPNEEEPLVFNIISDSQKNTFTFTPKQKTNLKPVSAEEASKIASQFSAFCPTDKIDCLKTPQGTTLSEIRFQPYRLCFEFKKSGSEIKAFSKDAFPGYAIATRQNHASISGLSSYLILENESGQKKILIPSSKGLPSLASKVLPFALPMPSFLKADKEETEYFAFDIAKNGRLTSENPKSLLYLTLLYSIQGKMTEALQTCEAFELQCRQKPLSENLDDFILYLCVLPFEYKKISQLRMRILAAIEENKCVRPLPKEIDKTASPTIEDSHWQDLVISGCIINDLKNNLEEKSSRKKLSHAQEWFLFKAFFNRSQSVFKHHFKSKVECEHVMECFGLIPSLMFRYQQLKQKFGRKNSLMENLFHFTKQVIQTSNPISNKFDLKSFLGVPQLQWQKDLDLIGKSIVGGYGFSLNSLDFKELGKLMIFEVSPATPFTIDQLNAKRLCQYFLTYYAIAKGECSENQAKKLRALLPLLKGGWDSQTATLVNYLEAVLATPKLFPKSEELQNALLHDIKNPVKDKQNLKLEAFFQTVHQRALGWRSASKTGLALTKIALNFMFSVASSSYFSVFNLLPSPFNSSVVFRLSEKIIGAFWKGNSTIEETPIASPLESPSHLYKGLEKVDSEVDAALYSIFFNAFELLPAEKEVQKEAEEFPIEDGDALSIRERKQRTNLSIQHYYKKEDQKITRYKLKDNEQLWKAYNQALSLRDTFMRQSESELEQLLSLINSHLPVSEYYHLSDLKKALLNANFEEIANEIHLPASALSTLEYAVAKHYVKMGRLGQLNRLVGHFEELANFSLDTSISKFEEKVEAIARECRARRAYSFDEMPLRITRRLIIFEALSNVILWKKQVSRINELLASGKENVVIELLMSFGKTFFGIPTTDSAEADGTKIVVNVFPKQMFGANARQIGTQSKEVYDQDNHVLSFNRASPANKDHLEGLSVFLQKVKEQKECINATKEDCQSLENRLIEWLFNKAHPELKTTSYGDDEIYDLQGVLRTLREHAKVIGDESQDLLHTKQELNHPLGKKSIIPFRFYRIIENCIKIVTADPAIKTRIEDNELDQLPVEEFKTRVIPLIATKMSLCPHLKLANSEEREAFINFIQGKQSFIPKILTSHSCYKEMCMVKGMTSSLLPLVFSHPAHVSYSKGNDECAKPCNGNMSVLENSTIRLAYETIVKTFILNFHKGLDQNQVKRLLIKLWKDAEESSQSLKISIQETKAYKLSQKIFPKDDLIAIHHYSQEQLNAFFDRAATNQNAILTYTRLFLWKKIQYWKLNICNNAHNFFSMFKAGTFDTGTPYNEGTYPPNLEMLWDKGTSGEALHIMTNRCPDDGIHVLNNSKPEKILEEILEQYFNQDSRFTAIIDGGALLKGISGKEVAKAMLQYCQKQRPDIKAIVFFQKDHAGNDQLMYLEKECEPKPFDQCPHSVSEYLSYFDQSHGFAANIPQKENGIGLKLVGADTKLFKEMQEWFRMRNIKKDKQLAPLSENQSEEKTQQIHIAMVKEMSQKISGTDHPTLHQTFAYALRQEAIEAAEENFAAFRQKIHNVIRRAVLDKILKAESISKMKNIFIEFEKVLVKEIEDDPEKLYGWIEDKKPTAEILKIAKDHAYRIIATSNTFTNSEKEKIHNDIYQMPTPVMPDQVTVFLDDTKIKINAFDDLGKEVSQEIKQDQELDIEVNQEQKQETDFIKAKQNIQVFQEWAWNENLDPYSSDWLLASKPMGLYGKIKSLIKTTLQSPPIFRFSEVLEKMKNSALFQLHQAIDKRLWFTNNFLPVKARNSSENVFEIGDKEQRELTEVLIDVIEDNGSFKILSMGCLSVKDAAFWRRKLAKRDTSKAPFKRVLYDLTLRTVIAGDKIDVEKFRQDTDLQSLEAQLKVLNGDTSFEKGLISSLMKWLTKNDAQNILSASYQIEEKRQRSNFEGSILEGVFEKILA